MPTTCLYRTILLCLIWCQVLRYLLSYGLRRPKYRSPTYIVRSIDHCFLAQDVMCRCPTSAESARRRDNRRHSDTRQDKATGGSHATRVVLTRRPDTGAKGEAPVKYTSVTGTPPNC